MPSYTLQRFSLSRLLWIFPTTPHTQPPIIVLHQKSSQTQAAATNRQDYGGTRTTNP